MSDLEFILLYKNKKSAWKVSKDLKIDYPNLSRGKTSKENEKRVADELKKEIIKIYSEIIVNGVIK